MGEKVKLAFIGCGGIVQSHLEGLKHFNDVEFVGWCDLDEGAAAARREQVGGYGTTYTDAAAMLDREKPDAVYVMLPPFAHGPSEALVIDHGLPFFVEKPVAIDLATASTVAAGAKAKGLITGVGYMTRYRESVQVVRRLLARQKPVLMHGGWLGNAPSEDSRIFDWWVRKERSGGQLMEQATHTVDLMRYLFGEVARVYAVPIRDRRPRPAIFNIEDASMVQLTFVNGAAANVYTSCSTSCGGGVNLAVWGTEMRAEFTGWAHDVTVHQPDTEPLRIAGESNIFALEDRAFVDAVKTGAADGLLATYEDGLEATRICCAADESMATGQAVSLVS